MSKSKKRKLKQRVEVGSKKLIRLSEKQMRIGAKAFLNRETNRILHLINQRKETKPESDEYKTFTFQIKTLVKGYNLTADLWKLERIEA